MEGWVGFDATYSELTYFRRFSAADFGAAGGDTCVGSYVGLGGEYSMWAGLMPAEANAFCYAAGQGYGNSWNICVGQQFTYNGAGNVAWSYRYNVETEGGWDYVYAMVDTSPNNDDVVVGVLHRLRVRYGQPVPGPRYGHA